MEEKSKKPREFWGLGIIGFNLAVFVVYSVLLLPWNDDFFLILHVGIYIFHAVICFIAAAIRRSWIWVFAGLIIIIIGFSACVAKFL